MAQSGFREQAASIARMKGVPIARANAVLSAAKTRKRRGRRRRTY